MAYKKVSELTECAAAIDDDYLLIVSGGKSKKIKLIDVLLPYLENKAVIEQNNGNRHVLIGVKKDEKTQWNVPMSSSPVAHTVLYHDNEGFITIKDPKKDQNPATKKYVDDTNPVKNGVLKVGNTEITEEQFKNAFKKFEVTIQFMALGFSGFVYVVNNETGESYDITTEGMLNLTITKGSTISFYNDGAYELALYDEYAAVGTLHTSGAFNYLVVANTTLTVAEE